MPDLKACTESQSSEAQILAAGMDHRAVGVLHKFRFRILVARDDHLQNSAMESGDQLMIDCCFDVLSSQQYFSQFRHGQKSLQSATHEFEPRHKLVSLSAPLSNPPFRSFSIAEECPKALNG